MDPDDLDRLVRQHASWGYDVRVVERTDIRAMEPRLIAPPERAAYAAGEGSIEPVAATTALLEAAESWGAEVRAGIGVREIAVKDRRASGITTASEVMSADRVVLAAGVDTTALSARLGVRLPMRSSPGLLVFSKPAPPLLNRVVEGPGLHMKQDPDGRIVAGEDFGGGPAPNDPEAEGARLLERIKTHLRDAGGLELERVSVGLRPIPEDRLPAVGAARGVEGLYVAVMHSGVTLAPIIGRLAAAEILDGVRVELLDPFRPERFATS